MNFYDILGIQQNASKTEIKKAYHKLVMLYHPDKCTDKDSNEKFQEIQTAYEILYDDDKRKEYDGMSTEQRSQVFDLIKQYFTDIKPQYSHIYNSIIDIIYSNEEEAFKTDINTFNIKNIFTRIADKILKNKKAIEIYNSNYDLKLTLKEKYNEVFKYVRIMKNNDESYNEYVIPTCDQEFTINDPEKGLIKINIITEEDTNYKIIDTYDLLHIKNISLSQYIYGGKVKIYDVNGDVTWFEFSSCLEKKPIFIIENKGLPKLTHDKQNRGNLFVYFVIEGINSIKGDDVAQTYFKVVEDTLKLMFPPID